MYPGIAAAGRRQKIKRIVLDGEIVALRDDWPERGGFVFVSERAWWVGQRRSRP
jgi:ATP-dependent DNA ligase